MGNLILCHDRHAAHPYEISRIHCRIFTIEELCYYLCNNLYLIDYTIMNEPLCTWLEEEIGMKELAEQLQRFDAYAWICRELCSYNLESFKDL